MKTNPEFQKKQKKSNTSRSETGHIKNVANFETAIAFCIGYGVPYNPSNAALTIVNLQAKWTTSKLKLKDVKDTKEIFDSVTGARQIIFKPLRPLATRIINALIAAKAPSTVIKDARTIVRKISGKRATDILIEVIPINKISVSQQSFDRLTDSFEELVILASTEVKYVPNELDLQITALELFVSQLNTINTTVKTNYVNYSNTMIARNNELYKTDEGLIDTAKEVKSYVKSLFGASSPQYRQISGIEFKKPPKDK